MPGSFFDPTTENRPHVCELPIPSAFSGRGWRCDCGEAYVLETMGERDRGVDPDESPYQWRRAPEFDELGLPLYPETRI